MFGATTSDPIGKIRGAIADLYAQAQVAERQHRYDDARSMRARAKQMETSLHARIVRREGTVAHLHKPPASPPGERAPYDTRLRGRLYAKRPVGYLPRWQMPPRHMPKKAPGPHNVIPPHPGYHRLPSPQKQGRSILTERGVQMERPFTASERANLQRLGDLIALWTKRARWAEVNKPSRAIFAWSQVDRYHGDRGMILRRAGHMRLWQRDAQRIASARQAGQSGRGARSPGRPGANTTPAPGRVPGVYSPLEARQRAAYERWRDPRGDMVFVDYDSMPAPDVPLPGTGPRSVLRNDPERPTGDEGGEQREREPASTELAPPAGGESEGGFLSKWGVWLLAGAAAVAAGYAYTQMKAKKGVRPGMSGPAAGAERQREAA